MAGCATYDEGYYLFLNMLLQTFQKYVVKRVLKWSKGKNKFVLLA